MLSQQLDLSFDPAPGLAEAGRYHPDSGGVHDFPYIAWNWRGGADERMQQKCVPAGRLAWLIRQIGTRPQWTGEHHFLVQNEFKAPNRRALNIWSFGLLWADLDLCSEEHDARTVDRWNQKALQDCLDQGIPEPSIVVWSGRGLHLKWVLQSRLPAQALPRWAAAMRAISQKLRGAGWPVDDSARDVSRVLRIAGSMNPKPDSAGRIIPRPVYVTHEGPSYDFEYLCEWLLPYTREQVAEFRENGQATASAEQWNRQRARAGQSVKRVLDAAALAAGEAEQSLHWRRLEVIRQAAAGRGGIQPGHRNEWLWIAANSLAWGLGDAGKLWHELPQLAREIAPSLSIGEARCSASSVYARLKEQGRAGLYRLKTATLVEKLGLSGDEARGLRGAGHGTKNPGAMGLEPLRDLTFEEWREEVRRRLQAGAGYTNAHRPPEAARKAQAASAQARAAGSEDKRSSARLMAARGMSSRQIAADLSVHQSTVVRWLG